MRQGIHRDLNRLRQLASEAESGEIPGRIIAEALDVIQRLFSDLARQLDQVEHDANTARNTQRRYGQR